MLTGSIGGGTAGIAANSANITNSGSITSAITGVTANALTVTNNAGGSISGGFFAIRSGFSNADFATVVNSGSITSAGAYAIYLD